MMRDENSADSGSGLRPSRRRFVQAAGLAGVTGLTGLSGCLGGGGGGANEITYGIISPMTGPYGGLAEGQRNGAELAIAHVNENDDIDVEITGVYEDTEADPSTGRRKAQSVVEQDGASYLMGAISSSVALALNEFAKEEEVIYNPGGAAVPITGSNCNEWVFRAETNTAQMAEAVSDFTAENLGTNVWFHIADYAYGESVMQRVEKRMKDGHDINVVGRSRSQLGSTNYNSYVSQIANSDADVAVLGMTGGDLINFVKQAAGQGLKENVNLMSPTMTFAVVRGALGEAAYGTYGGVRYLPSLETGDNQSFVEAYQSEYNSAPDNFARAAYMSIRMTAQGIAEADSTDPAEVKDVLPGLEMDTILGPNQFRDCDHQAMNPVWPGELVAPEGGSGPAAVELGEMIDGSDALPDCGELGCTL
ncbi:amino acid/amide ABC transporter substrate-binding protein, HAAT family [Haloferax larsenii]|uniref:Amino acid/amide ABC transporter substrate-binding protein, HAAT family n=2 Tax=Haloferax larsenii TaxID=302484 RepID=A0A1H7PJ82_HALLR|nr:amino acid/amide ABC transporter substrate-binding protein, HAAT family [Haloferax larsenii]